MISYRFGNRRRLWAHENILSWPGSIFAVSPAADYRDANFVLSSNGGFRPKASTSNLPLGPLAEIHLGNLVLVIVLRIGAEERFDAGE